MKLRREMGTRPRRTLTPQGLKFCGVDSVEAVARPAEVPSLILDPSSPFSDLYLKKARYKVYWGGRGAAKSWNIAEALIRIAAATCVRILCVREFQTSIATSSHQLLKDTITRLGLQSWFKITERSIVSKTGAEFLFMGLHQNEAGIRSTEGIDICWVEEAHSVAASSWRVLLPTIRKPGSEIWVSFNMNEETDPAYKMFVKAPPKVAGTTVCEGVRPNSIVHRVNYDNNPFFPDVLREEMETDKALDYHLYEHIWLGMPLHIGSEIIMAGKYEVKDFADDLWKKADRVHLGADFGYIDPSALIRCFVLEEFTSDGKPVRNLYIEHEAYETGVDIDKMDEFYQRVPGSKDWPIKSDAARPEFPTHLRQFGYSIDAAEKWQGSVEDGIAFLRGFHRIFIHPRCVNTAREARLYRYKVDQKQLDEHGRPIVLPVIVDKHNHTWDAIRYAFDGYIMRAGDVGIWQRLGQQASGVH